MPSGEQLLTCRIPLFIYKPAWDPGCHLLAMPFPYPDGMPPGLAIPFRHWIPVGNLLADLLDVLDVLDDLDDLANQVLDPVCHGTRVL